MIEVAGYVFVPIATTILADLGADVIKIEPVTGDPLGAGRPGGRHDAVPFDAVELLVEIANRGERSVALDPSTEEGLFALRKLLPTGAVFATSYLEAVRHRLQLDVEHVHAVDASLVYAHGTGWGALSPIRDAPAFDLVSAWPGAASLR